MHHCGIQISPAKQVHIGVRMVALNFFLDFFEADHRTGL
jgi:hypothetical protein